jgi:thioredoxin 1
VPLDSLKRHGILESDTPGGIPRIGGTLGAKINREVIKVSAFVKEISDNDFDRVISESELPVLVDFWAPWCGPCRMVAPVVEAVAQEYDGKLQVVKVNVDENPSTASSFGIMSIPTLGVFKGGQLVKRLVGYMPKETLKANLERVL